MSIILTPPTPLWSRAQQPLEDTHAMLTAKAWLDSDAWGLLMLGGVGRGKSQAAAWLWHRLERQEYRHACDTYRGRRDVLWLRARLLQRLDWGERARIIERCSNAVALVMDELGGEDEKTSEAVSDIVEQRGDEKRRTVLTTNLSGAEFLKRYGDRITSRLRSGGVEPTQDGQGRARWAVLVQGSDLRGTMETPPPPKEPEPAKEPVVDFDMAKMTAAFLRQILDENRFDSDDEDRRAAGGSEG